MITRSCQFQAEFRIFLFTDHTLLLLNSFRSEIPAVETLIAAISQQFWAYRAMVTIEEREAYLRNPFFKEEDRIKGDFTPFYITIAACTLLALFLFVLNLICGCCSKYREYWNDRHTGNRWLVTIFTTSPHKSPPLDLEELANVKIDYPKSFYPVSHQDKCATNWVKQTFSYWVLTHFRARSNKHTTTKEKNSSEQEEHLDRHSIIKDLLSTLKSHIRDLSSQSHSRQEQERNSLNYRNAKVQFKVIMAVVYLMFPCIALVAMFVIGVIMFILKHGPTYLNNKRFVWTGGPVDDEGQRNRAYSQSVSVA